VTNLELLLNVIACIEPIHEMKQKPSYKEMKAQMGSLAFQMDINLEKMEACL
jgi:hypothetical protein